MRGYDGYEVVILCVVAASPKHLQYSEGETVRALGKDFVYVGQFTLTEKTSKKKIVKYR